MRLLRPIMPAAALAACVGVLRPQQPVSTPEFRAAADQYCVSCHNEKLRTGGLGLSGAPSTEVLEKVARRLRARTMPPPRGGALVPYNLPRDAEYQIQLRLTRDRNEHVEGLNEAHQLDLAIDGAAGVSTVVDPEPVISGTTK